MGRQLEFFMNSEDEKEFLEFVKRSGDVEILPHHIYSLESAGVTRLPEPVAENFNYALYLFNRSASSRLITRYVDSLDCYIVDDSVSSVIEFTRTIREGSTIRPGRIYAQFKYVDADGNWASKEPEFQKWYETLARWIRKNYSREIDPTYYFGRGALKMVKHGEVEVRY
jgi:hypothetical protein